MTQALKYLEPYSQPYYVIMVKCGTEIKSRERLLEDGHDVQCPLIKQKKKIRHRKAKSEVEVTKPLFDGYLFVGVDTAPSPERLKVTSDVLKIVSFNGEPALVYQEELLRIEELVADLMRVEEEKTKQRQNSIPQFFNKGDKLRITHGGLQVDGVYVGNNYALAKVFGADIKIKIRHANVIRLT